MSPRSTPRPLVDALGSKRLVFTVTTGRSGTELLARVLALFPGVAARHEPRPRFSSAFRAVLRHPELARDFWLEEKLPRIATTRGAVYAETSHLACKGFLEPLVELGFRPTIVHLVRPARDVATSLWRLGWIPSRTLRGTKHFLSPSDPSHLPVRELSTWTPSDWQLCYWSCLEIERRAEALRARLEPRGVRVVRVELADLATEDGIHALGRALELRELGFVGRTRARRLAGSRVNARDAHKRADELEPARLEAWEAEVRERTSSPSVRPPR
jgi:hypothetical protein